MRLISKAKRFTHIQYDIKLLYDNSLNIQFCRVSSVGLSFAEADVV